MSDKISCWCVGNGTAITRIGAWEVSHPSDDGKDTCTATFSGPKARERAEAYADYLRGEALLS